MSRFLDPELVRQALGTAGQGKGRTIDRLHGLARDHHTNSPLLHWLDAPSATRRLLRAAQRGDGSTGKVVA